jgi:hypothetical protein
MELIKLLLKFSFWIDYEGCVVEIGPLFSRDTADSVHLMLRTLLFDGIECGGIREILSKFMHVGFNIW